MKRVLVHWMEVRTLEVPDECPTDDESKFEQWLFDHAKNSPYTDDPYKANDQHTFVTKSDTRDFEIVDVTAIVPENEKVGSGEDKYQR